MAARSQDIARLGNQAGEGWYLTAEMVDMIEHGCPNIICAQPFACLPNHIVGKGMFRALRSRYPEANIVAVDYDPGASEVNQLNRIKLMLSTAIERRKDSGEDSEVLELRGIDFESEEGFGSEGLPFGACACGSSACGNSAGAEGEVARSCSGAGSGAEGFERAQPVSLGMPGVPPRRGVALR